MRIILDSNIIHKDYHLTGTRIITLSESVTKLGYEVMIPEVVVDEIESQYRSELIETYSNFKTSIKRLQSLVDFRAYDQVDLDEILEEKMSSFYNEYVARLKQLGIRILPYPKTSHKHLVSKELWRKKPFKDSKKGYRDALIWETVIDELKTFYGLFPESQIVFLTQNTRDFSDNDALHGDLVCELIENNYGENAVKIVSDIDSFFRNEIISKYEILDEIKDALNKKGFYNCISVKNDIESLLNEEFVQFMLDDTDDIGLGTFLPSYCTDPYVDFLNDSISTVDTVFRLQDGSVMISCDVNAMAEVSYYIERSDYFAICEHIHPNVINPEHNDYYMEVSNCMELSMKITIITSPELTKVLSHEVIPLGISILA